MFGRHPAILSASGSSASFMRALQPAAWFRADTGVTVTGQGVSTLADQSGNGRDLLQGTDASRPPYLSYSGTKYLYLPGAAGNYASTPDSVAASITGDIELQIRLSLNDWTPAAAMSVLSKADSNTTRSYYLTVNATTGTLVMASSPDGTAGSQVSGTSSAAPTVSDGQAIWLRVTLDVNDGSGNRVYKFYTAADSDTVPTSWSQLGTTQTVAGATTIHDNASVVEIGSVIAGTAQVAAGNVYRALIYSGFSDAGGTLKVDFNPNLDASDASTSFASSATGETWTVNKGSSGLIAYLVGKPWLMGDGSADILATSGFTLNQPLTRFIVGKSLTWTLNDYIADGNAKDSAAFIQSATTPRFKISAGSAVGENAGLALNTLGVMCAVVNGASSLTQVNLGTPVTGNAGAANAGGLTLFGSGTVATGFWNGMIVEDITFPTALDATQRARVIQYLAGRHGIAL